MLRFYRDTIQKLAVLLQWIKYQGVQPLDGQIRVHDLLNWLGGSDARATLSTEKRHTLVVAADSLYRQRVPFEFDEVLEAVIQQLARDENGYGDKDLLNSIIEALKLPYSVNRLSTKAIKILRDALLVPEEARRLKAELDAKELYCNRCERKLRNGETGTIFRDSSGVYLSCSRCSLPSYMPCSNCDDGVVAISPAIRKLFQKESLCDDCRSMKKVKQEQGVIDEVTPVVQEAPIDPQTVADSPPVADSLPNFAWGNAATNAFQQLYETAQQGQPSRFRTLRITPPLPNPFDDNDGGPF
jgi:hypothetical protein